MKGKYAVFIGSTDIDEYYACDHWPVLGDKALIRYMESKVGGMVANAASIYGSYGADTFLLGVIGTDAYTPVILDELRQCGIHTDYLDIASDCPNGKTHILLTGSERTIFVVVNPDKPSLMVDDRKRELLLDASYVYTTISELRKIAGHRQMIDAMKARGARLALDVESESFADRGADAWYFGQADLLFFNEFAFGKYGSGIGDDAAFGRLLDREDKMVAVTLGARGCHVRTLREQYDVKGIPVQPIDTTGAGDTFNASFMYGLSRGWEVLHTARFANGAAARSTLFLGPKSGIAPEAEITAFIDRGPAFHS